MTLQRKKLLQVLSIFLPVFAMLGCQGEAKFNSSSRLASSGSGQLLAAGSLTIEPETATIKIGETTKYKVTLKKNGAVDAVVTDKVKWSFDKISVGEISDAAQGQVTGKAEGLAKITATVDGLVGSASLSVEAPQPDGAEFVLTISPDNFPLPIGGTRALQALAKYADGKVEDVTSKTAWTSTSPIIATVDDNAAKGSVKALAAGKVILGASFSGKSATSTLAVAQPLIVDLKKQVGKAVSVCVAYDKIKIPGHKCDRAVFNLSLTKVPVGSFNLNNVASAGASVEGGRFKSAWDESGAFEMTLKCKLAGGCHADVSIVSIIGEVIDEYGRTKWVVIDQGLAKPEVVYNYKFADFVLKDRAPVFGALCDVQ